MSISANSRYLQSDVQVFDVGGRSRQVILPSDPAVQQFRFTYHQVAGHERIDTIAGDYYGDATRWWVIANANPEILLWQDLRAGMIIRIPAV